MTDKKKSKACTKHILFLLVSVLITVGLYSAYQCDNIHNKPKDGNLRGLEKKPGEKDQKEVLIMEKNARYETNYAIFVIVTWLFFLILFATIIYCNFQEEETKIYKIVV